MKVDRLETHDRFTYFKQQEFDIGECCQNLIEQRPFGDHGFYIFAHARTEDDGVSRRIIWQPRLTKPKAQPNSMLFKVKPGSDVVEIRWILPDQLMWKEYEENKMFADETVLWSIHQYKTNKKQLESKEEDDLPDNKIDQIYKEISLSANRKKGKKS